MKIQVDSSPQGLNPNQFLSLDIPVSSTLETLLEYEGTARWVAFFWEAPHDEVRYTDGQVEGVGDWASWFTFTQHPAVAPLLQTYGSDEIQPWLLIDRQQHSLYLGKADAVQQFLAQSIRQAEVCPPPVSKELNLGRIIKQRARLLNELRQCLDERTSRLNRNVNYQLHSSRQYC